MSIYDETSRFVTQGTFKSASPRKADDLSVTGSKMSASNERMISTSQLTGKVVVRLTTRSVAASGKTKTF